MRPPDRLDRRSYRLGGYDYAHPGAYFVTICTHERAPVFGRVRGGRMHPSNAGRIAEDVWHTIPGHHPRVVLDAFVVMPDHVHAIVIIVPADEPPGGATHASPSPSPFPPAPSFPPSLWSATSNAPRHVTPIDGPRRRLVPQSPRSNALGTVIGAYKGAVTRAARAAGAVGSGPLWQRNYYERVVRDADALHRIRRYIELNPARWTGRRRGG